MHIGRAATVPMAVLGPSWQDPIEWLPLNRPGIRILRGPDNFIEYGHVPRDYRLDEITAPEVQQAADALLQSHPPSATARESRALRLLSITRS
jgi:hypothetical protein